MLVLNEPRENISCQSIFISISIFQGDGSIGIEEFRYDCVSRMAYPNVSQYTLNEIEDKD